MPDILIEYDKYDKYSIERYGQGMVDKTFRDICGKPASIKRWENPRKKGSLGELVEVEYFHYETNSNPTPDFEEAGSSSSQQDTSSALIMRPRQKNALS